MNDIYITPSLYFFYVLGVVLGFFFGRSIYKPNKGTRIIKEGQRIFVRLFWTDDRGNMSKNRHYRVWNFTACYDYDEKTNKTFEIPNEHFLQLVGDEPEDEATKKELGYETI